MSTETIKKRGKRGRAMSPEQKDKIAEGARTVSAKHEAQARAQQQADHISGEVMTVEAPMPVRSALADVHVPKEVEPKSAPLSPQYLNELKSEKTQLEGSLLGESGMKIKNQSDLHGLPAGVFDSAPEFAAKIDGDSARKRIAEIDKIISDATTVATSPTRRDSLNQELKHLEKEVSEGMLHQNDYFLPDSKSKNGVLLQNHGQYNLDWHEHNSSRISRIKHLRQTLDPERYQTDSTYRSIETIRPGAPALKRFEPSSASVMIQGWEDPGLSDTEKAIRMFKNLDPETIAEEQGTTVEEILRIQGKLSEPASA
jgi:hypothetical protein